MTFRPLTPSRWKDLVILFGANGACGGCWCMWWRVSRRDFVAKKGEANRRAFQRMVRAGAAPGVLAYAGKEPVGWCAIEPRATFPRLANSRVLAPIDDEPVWSVTCFFVKRGHRGQSVARALLAAAVEHARKKGARIVEGYPVRLARGKTADAFVYTGVPSIFEGAGFRVAAQRSASRPIMRLALDRPARRRATRDA